ncbi:MAG TPA: gluconokinase [Jatrophihabitans sp.]|nr:gluconokinase [Jatrophihabitans sp.]
MTDFARPPILVLMGVSGSGKSTVGHVLAERLGWDFGEGDDLHPPENVAKMAAGQPLTDEDRWPWLARVRGWIDEHIRAGEPAIITCSALKRKYRDMLRDPHVVFVYLAGPRDLVAARLAARQGHYMPESLLDSQLADLEPPEPDEQAITVHIGPEPSAQAAEIVERLGLA